MKKKIILAVIGLLVVMSMISRCGSGKNDEKAVDENVSVNEAGESGKEAGLVTEDVLEETDNDDAADSKTVAKSEIVNEEDQKKSESEITKESDKKSDKDSAGADREEKSEEEVTPEFKEAMDSYEKFFDEYVEFMKKYSESDDTLGMLSDYSDYLVQYTETMEKMDKIDTEELSTADYAYYIEVTARIQKKLLEVGAY